MGCAVSAATPHAQASANLAVEPIREESLMLNATVLPPKRTVDVVSARLLISTAQLSSPQRLKANRLPGTVTLLPLVKMASARASPALRLTKKTARSTTTLPASGCRNGLPEFSTGRPSPRVSDSPSSRVSFLTVTAPLPFVLMWRTRRCPAPLRTMRSTRPPQPNVHQPSIVSACDSLVESGKAIVPVRRDRS